MNEGSTNPESASPSAGPDAITRRRFFERVSLALGGFVALLLGVPVVGFILSPLFQKIPEMWRTVGSVEDFKIGETASVTFLDASPLPWAGVTARTAAWLRRRGENDFVAFAVNCSHLGCPVRWLPQADLFMCPCHGGVYYNDGTVAAGPPPHSLSRYEVRVKDGKVQIRTHAIRIA